MTPYIGVSLPVTGVVIFLDHTWNDMLTSSAGWSFVNINNSDGQKPSDYHQGQYVVFNLLATPVKNVMMGGEFQYAHRENFSDGFKVDDVRIQVSFKYSFGLKVGG